MHRLITTFLHYCAVVDSTVMADSTEFDRLRYSIVGALVLVTSAAASVGWGFKSYLATDSIRFSLIVAIGVGTCVFFIERMLIATITPGSHFLIKLSAFIWRGTLACLTSAFVVFPFMLWSFQPEIAVQREKDRVQQIFASRTAVEEAYALGILRERVSDNDKLLEGNRLLRSQLPADVVEAGTLTSGCTTELSSLQKTTDAALASNAASMRALRGRLAQLLIDAQNSNRSELTATQKAIDALSQRNRQLRAVLARKTDECSNLAKAFATAKANFYSRVDSERQTLIARSNDLQAALTSSSSSALTTFSQSEVAISLSSAPGLQADTAALIKLVRDNSDILGIVAATYVLSLFVELLPLLSKIVLQSPYDALFAARAARLSSAAITEIATSRMAAEIRQIDAAAATRARKEYLRNPKAGAFYEAAEKQAGFVADRLWASSIFDDFDRMVERAQASHLAVLKAQDDIQHPLASSVLDELWQQMLTRLARRQKDGESASEELKHE